MSRSRVFVSLMVAVMVGSMAWVPVAVAQDATPAARLGAPAPSECTVEPRPASYFAQFIGTPTSAQEAARMTVATPPAGFQMPAGEAADEATVAAVVETVWQLGACVNAGDFFGRYAALFTEESLRRQFAEFGPLAEADLAMLSATPTALPEDARVALLAVEEVRLLPDGRVAGLFQIYDAFAAEPGPARYYWVFAEVDGRWLIDEEIMLGPLTAGMEGATPAP